MMTPTKSLKNLGYAGAMAMLIAAAPASAVNLADAPLFSTVVVPGNLALTLSVEWPTATTPAYPSSTAYSSASTYLGYFDPQKCYRYIYNSGTPSSSYFTPDSAASNRTCTSNSTVQRWSGNYLNWASMQTLDTFRGVLTGGYRSKDTTTETIITKTYASFDSGVMPDKSISTGTSGATPFNWSSVNTRLRTLGTAMYLTRTGNLYGGSIVDYNGQNSYVPATIWQIWRFVANPAYANDATVYRVYINVKVCDSTVGLEDNCVAYGSNYKPEGLLQKYSQKLRYAAFGYYNDSNILRDGGVLRARMKYIGPTQPVPGSTATSNANREWDPSTGIMVRNPDSTDASATQTFAAAAGWTVSISDSGVMNYLNKFGNSGRPYKSFDPVSELYYSALRYFKNQGNVASYTSLSGSWSPGSSATAANWLDDFPAITTWSDPILYSCQKNFILGIGDTNAWRDANLPGTTLRATDEPAQPTEVSGDTTVNVKTATDMVGQLEGLTNLGNTYAWVGGDAGRGNTYYLAGLAYDAHTRDIRSDLTGQQTINTYWMDVYESGYISRNQYWLATKYGGFTIPTGFDPYAASNGTSTIPTANWSSTTTTLNGTDRRPDNYFPSNSPDLLKSGLEAAFEKIAAEAGEITTTGFSAPAAVQAASGNANYAVSYNPNNWTSSLDGRIVSYNSSGVPTVSEVWSATTLLNARTASNRLIVTCCTSTGAGLPFTLASLQGSSLNSRTNYTSFGSVPNVASGSQSVSNYIDYLRGDRTREVANGGAYRTRANLLADIVNAQLAPVSAPNEGYYDTYNPGYSKFVSDNANRTTVVYAASNGGMLHAFDGSVPATATGTCTSGISGSSCGKELFAYIPSFAYVGGTSASTTGLASLGNPTAFSHRYLIDSTPVTKDVDFYKTPGTTFTSNAWRTILVGGLGKGGKGYYALNITSPGTWTSETNVASSVLWEFTNANMGYSFGKPVIVKTPEYGWTVIVSSGYNNSDGKGYLFFLNPRTGALLRTVATTEGSTTSPINLAQISAFIPSKPNHLADAIYAGDLRGNVWRVDLTPTENRTTVSGTTTTTTTYDYRLTKIATLTDANGSPQAITTTPVVAADPSSNKRYVLVGTGKLLDDSDISTSQTQTFYAIRDGDKGFGRFFSTGTTTTSGSTTSVSAGQAYPSATFTPPITRSNLTSVTSLVSGIGSSPANYGWYYNLAVSTGGVAEHVNIDPVEVNGVVAFAANLPSGDACNARGTARGFAVYYGDARTALTQIGTGGASVPLEAVSSSQSISNIAIVSTPGAGTSVIFGKSDGGLESLKTPSKPTFRRLNWREVLISD